MNDLDNESTNDSGLFEWACIAIGKLIIASLAVGLGFWLVGTKSYVIIAGCVMTIIVTMMWARHGLRNNDESAPGWIWILMTLMFGAVLGLVWPWLPTVYMWKSKVDERPPEA